MSNKNFHEKIKAARTAKNATQEEAAKVLGISRSSYISVEQGKRELTVSEKSAFEEKFGRLAEDNEPNYAKYREMLVTFLREFGDKEIPKTKLAKLLYLADFGWFYENSESMSNMPYRRIQFGPVPDAYFRIVEELESEGVIRVRPEERPDNGLAYMISEAPTHTSEKIKLISKDEQKHIAKIAKKWKDARTNEIVDFTHRQYPYLICSENEVIPYELIIMEDYDKIY